MKILTQKFSAALLTVVYFIEWDTSERGDSGQIGPVASGEFEISADFHMITPIENPKCTEGNNMPNLNSQEVVEPGVEPKSQESVAQVRSIALNRMTEKFKSSVGCKSVVTYRNKLVV